jgi:hypothetical protein
MADEGASSVTTNLTYCIRGCTRTNSDGNREPVHASTGNLCRSCLGRLDKWLREIPDRYTEVPTYLEPTTDLDKNPESKTTKRTTAPVPVRLDALDLLDTRRIRRWQGLVPTEDRRGTLGTLLAIANELRSMRGIRPALNGVVWGEAEYIRLGIDRLACSDGIADTYEEVRILHRQLGDAIGDYPPKPIADCTIDTEEGPCGGPILPNVAGGVYCPRCGTRWDINALRLLGLTLSVPGETA